MAVLTASAGPGVVPTAVAATPAPADRGAARARAAPVSGPVVYQAPVPVVVVNAFAPPTTRYGAGHLGVDLAAAQGAVVRAAADGVVSFAGTVAGRALVVITHADGIRTEYEPLRVDVRAGQSVRGGQRIGVVSGSHRYCGTRSCLHWGARRGDQYLDPLRLLAPLGPVRLLPWA